MPCVEIRLCRDLGAATNGRHSMAETKLYWLSVGDGPHFAVRLRV